jgi:DNA-directed RNA polymerase subunit A'
MVFRASSCRGCDECQRENCERDAYVQIIDGTLKSGVIDKKAVGAFDGASFIVSFGSMAMSVLHALSMT